MMCQQGQLEDGLVQPCILRFSVDGFLNSTRCKTDVCFLITLSKASFDIAICSQGVNPWIEVDGGVTPENAYKVR
jgi:hypothetical protein